MSCSNKQDILLSEDIDFDDIQHVNKLEKNYVEIINKTEKGNYIKNCFVRNQLLDYFSGDYKGQVTLWGNGNLENRYKPVYKHVYSGYFITQESMYFLSLPNYKTFLSVECGNFKIGSYFSVSAIHGTSEKVCRLIPLIEIDKNQKSSYPEDRIIELKIENETKTYLYGFIKTDDFTFNLIKGTFIGDLNNFGYFFVNKMNSVFDTSIPSTQVFFNGQDNWIKYIFEEKYIGIDFKFKLGEREHNIRCRIEEEKQEEEEYLKITLKFGDKEYVFNNHYKNYIEDYYSKYNAYSKMQILKIYMLCLLTHLKLIDEKYDYIFYGVNIKNFVNTYVNIVNNFVRNNKLLIDISLENFIKNEKLSNILRRISNNFDISLLEVIVKLGNILSILKKYDNISENAIEEYIDRFNKNLLMLILEEYIKNIGDKDDVLEFIQKYNGDINKLDVDNNYALKQALKIYIYKEEREFIDLLISKGANINIDVNFSLLHYAVYKQSYEGVQYLLEKGININTLSTVYFEDCDRKVTALELNAYLDKLAGIDIDDIDETKNLNIKRILLSNGSNPVREIEDIICEQDEGEYEDDEGEYEDGEVFQGEQDDYEQGDEKEYDDYEGEEQGDEKEYDDYEGEEQGDEKEYDDYEGDEKDDEKEYDDYEGDEKDDEKEYDDYEGDEKDDELFEKIKNETSEDEITRIINELTEDDYERIQLRYHYKSILYFLLQNSVVNSNIELFRNILNKMTTEKYIYYIREVIEAKPSIELLKIIGEQEFYDQDELDEILDELRVLNTDGSYDYLISYFGYTNENVEDYQFIEEKLNIVKNSDDIDEILDIIDIMKEENVLESKNSEGYPISHLIILNNNIDDEDKIKAIDYLANKEYNLDIADWNDNTMLQYAVYEHLEDLVDYLLTWNLDIDHISSKGIFKDLNLKQIAMLKPNYEETVKLLDNFRNF